jgi:hypothetical protein
MSRRKYAAISFHESRRSVTGLVDRPLDAPNRSDMACVEVAFYAAMGRRDAKGYG